MNLKKGSNSIEIKSLDPSSCIKKLESAGAKPGCGFQIFASLGRHCWAFQKEVWEFCKEDSNRVIFALKVGLAVLLVSLLMLIQAPYQLFGTSIIWSILTVAIMFEYTVGATFNRGFNRALGSLLAGVLAIAIAQLALHMGRIMKPVLIALSIFLVGTITSFLKLWPSFVQYEYGFRVVLFTFCLIVLSGYRVGDPIQTALDRLYSIAIGGFVAMLVNVLICPIWAGEQLQRELVNSFNSVAEALEECVGKYIEGNKSEGLEFSTTAMGGFPDEPAYRKCWETLNSSAKLDALANAAKWEPPHGRFRCFFYPWSEYVKVGAVLRYCAYEIVSLHGVLHSEIQAPHDLRIRFRQEIQDTSNQAAELVRSLAKDISNMEQNLHMGLQNNVHSSAEQLQQKIDMHAFLLTSTSNSQANQFSAEHHINTLPSNSKLPNRNLIPWTTLLHAPPEPFSDTAKRHSRRLHSWPSIEVGALDREVESSTDSLPRMRTLESTAALSVATFTSLLIEFVARLDHLAEAVDKLSKTARFKQE